LIFSCSTVKLRKLFDEAETKIKVEIDVKVEDSKTWDCEIEDGRPTTADCQLPTAN